MVHSLIAQEVAAGIPTKKIVIGGFSQGGALALYSALTFSEPLAGVIALSSWLPLHQRFPAVSISHFPLSKLRRKKIIRWQSSMITQQDALGNKNVPVLQCHGDCDPIVPYKWGQMTASLLKQFMTNTEFKTYQGMMHTSCEEVSLLFCFSCYLNKCFWPLKSFLTNSLELFLLFILFLLLLFSFTGNARHESVCWKSSQAVMKLIKF